jgi:DNA-binding CsgD family transcriptional regulator
MHRGAVEEVQGAVTRLAHRGLEATDLYARAIVALPPVMRIDGWCGLIMDPATVLSTGGIHDYGIPYRYLPRMVENEYAEPDVNKFADLGLRNVPAATLSHATGGNPGTSSRYQSVLRPSSFGDELRVSLRCGKATWGALVLLRGDGEPAFTSAEAALLGGIAPVLGEGVRRSLLLASSAAPGDGYGIVLLDNEGHLESMNSDAERFVGELVESGRSDGGLPPTIQALAARARQLPTSWASPDNKPARARARTRSGAWLTLHGSCLNSGAVTRTAVVIEPSRPPEIATLLLQAYGLSQRELEIAQMLLAGLSVPHIARLLMLSPYTARDHLKSIFQKVGVNSKQELVAAVYLRHYVPELARGATPGPTGWFG